MMSWIRRIIYRRGIRPSFGSTFYSPSLHFHYLIVDVVKKVREKGLP